MKIQERSQRKNTLKWLQPFISPQTDLLHVNRTVKPYKKDDLIPISYNFLYQLLLFRMKERAPIEEALRELNHLLNFQIQEGESKGNFPIYLHQYPNCERTFEVLFALFPLYWIAKDFSNLIEPTLKSKLYQALRSGIEFIQKMECGKEFSYLLSLQTAALTLAIGRFLDDELWVESGAKSLENLAKRGAQECWGSPRNLSKMLIALNLMRETSEIEHWAPFFAYLNKSWYPQARSYLGPGLTEYFEGDQEEATLYHLYMERQTTSELQLNYSPLVYLEEELLLHSEVDTKEFLLQAPVFFGSYQWGSYSSDLFGYTFTNLVQGEWVKTGGFNPLKVVLPSEKGPNTLILQMGSPVDIQRISENKLLLKIDPPIEGELDVSFFWNLSSKASLLVDGLKASTFKLDQKLEFSFPKGTLAFSFPEGSSQIWGQIMRKNRRTQLLESETEFFEGHLYFRQIATLINPFYIEIEIQI